MDKKEDRRIQRTRSTIFEAFIDLMIEKGYDKLTVQDIIDRANVGRSTFYLHFNDKEELLQESISQLRMFIKEQSIVLLKTNDERKFSFSLAMFQHVLGHRRLYEAIVKKSGGTIVVFYIQKMISEIIKEDIAKILPDYAYMIPKEVIVDFVANTFILMLGWWLEQKEACSAVEADRIFHKLAIEGLSGLKIKTNSFKI